MTSSPIEAPNFPLPLFMHMTVFIRIELYIVVFSIFCRTHWTRTAMWSRNFGPSSSVSSARVPCTASFTWFSAASWLTSSARVLGRKSWRELAPWRNFCGGWKNDGWSSLCHIFFVGKFVLAKNCFLRFLLAHVVDLFVLQVLKQVRHWRWINAFWDETLWR